MNKNPYYQPKPFRELSHAKIAILMGDGRERTAEDVAKKLKVSRMTASTHLKSMSKIGLLNRELLGGIMVYGAA